MVCSLGIFPDALSRSTGGDSCDSCGAGGCAAPNAKTFFGASLILLVFDAPQGICFPMDDVGNLRMKRGITLNSDRCLVGLFMNIPSNSDKGPFLLEPGHGGR